MPNKLVIVHGYSDKGESFKPWREILAADYGGDVAQLPICDYITLSNEITIKDIAEGFDRYLEKAGIGPDETFDALVHSTGMLVIRSWLTTYPTRKGRLKRLIALAPATFGSPLAKTGRSLLGSVFKGDWRLGPDFMEAGDLVLDGLELGSPFTWDLAHKDLFGTHAYFGETDETPYVFIFCGTAAYPGLRKLVNQPGTDGTVRLAGCGLNVRKIKLDLTRNGTVNAGAGTGPVERIVFENWKNTNIPVTLIPDVDREQSVNHGTIVSNPPAMLKDLVRRALAVDSKESYEAWLRKAAEVRAKTDADGKRWQQFIVRAMDERGDPVPDYSVELFTKDADGNEVRVEEFDSCVDVYSRDSSFRTFHFDVDEMRKHTSLTLSLMASSGSQYIDYLSYRPEDGVPAGLPTTSYREWTARFDLTPLIQGGAEKEFFKPFTTTLVELYLDREPKGLVNPI